MPIPAYASCALRSFFRRGRQETGKKGLGRKRKEEPSSTTLVVYWSRQVVAILKWFEIGRKELGRIKKKQSSTTALVV